MIHYHGTPITPESAAVEILRGRHGLVSFANPQQIGLVSEVCQSFVLDNGAFSFWKSGKTVDTEAYYRWVDDWRVHPGYDWALIPDIIEGSAADNDNLIYDWPFKFGGVPVWHLHEPVERLRGLAEEWERVAVGSSAAYSKVGTSIWWDRIQEALEVICKNGSPGTKLHGLRMLDPRIFSKLPFASADSTNVARNIGIDKKWKGTYLPPSKAARGVVIASRIESFQSAPLWMVN